MTIDKSDKVLIEDLRRDAAVWFKDSSLCDLEELIARYLRMLAERESGKC